MLRQRSDDHQMEREKRSRVETHTLTTRMRTPSPNPGIATVSRSNRVRAELQAILDSFCCVDRSAFGAQVQLPTPQLFAYADGPSFSGKEASNPSPLLVLLELSEVCEQVWRVGTCASGPTYTVQRSGNPLDDTHYSPCDLLFPVAVGARGGSSPSKVGSGLNSNSTEDIFLPASQQESPQIPFTLNKCTMHPLTSHTLLTLGGFERTPCGGFIHMRPVIGAHREVDLKVPQDILNERYFSRPTVSPNVLNPIQPTSFTTMCAMHAACLSLLEEKGALPKVLANPLTIYVGDADGFGWHDNRDTLGACRDILVDRAKQAIEAGQDAVFLLWAIMLTDGGLPQLEKGVQRAAQGGLCHCYSSHFWYGTGSGALCVQSVPDRSAAARRQRDEEMLAYCDGNYIGSAASLQPLLVSPPHVLLRARVDFGCSLVLMPAGHAGPIVVLFYINRAQWGDDDASVSPHLVPNESISEKSLRYLWWYTHHVTLAHFPPNRIHLVCSVGELLRPQQVDMLPTKSRDVPRLNGIEAMCCEGYTFSFDGAKRTTAKGCRFICTSSNPASSPPIRYVDL